VPLRMTSANATSPGRLSSPFFADTGRSVNTLSTFQSCSDAIELSRAT
jgi:hypothetical protein